MPSVDPLEEVLNELTTALVPIGLVDRQHGNLCASESTLLLMEVDETAQGWFIDPNGVHEHRWVSLGDPPNPVLVART